MFRDLSKYCPYCPRPHEQKLGCTKYDLPNTTTIRLRSTHRSTELAIIGRRPPRTAPCICVQFAMTVTSVNSHATLLQHSGQCVDSAGTSHPSNKAHHPLASDCSAHKRRTSPAGIYAAVGCLVHVSRQCPSCNVLCRESWRMVPRLRRGIRGPEERDEIINVNAEDPGLFKDLIVGLLGDLRGVPSSHSHVGRILKPVGPMFLERNNLTN